MNKEEIDTFLANAEKLQELARQASLADALQRELTLVSNHSHCRRNLLVEIHRILGPDGGESTVNAATGLTGAHARLPKRVERLAADVAEWRDKHDAKARQLSDLEDSAAFLRNLLDRIADLLGTEDYQPPLEDMPNLVSKLQQENETLARQVPPEPASLKQTISGDETGYNTLYRQGRTITDLRDLLTSAHAIALRSGKDTNWDAFIMQLRKRGIGSVTAKVFKMPKDDAVFWNPHNGVVQDHRDGAVIQPDTDKEREKRGLPPFTPDPGPQKLRDRIRHAINCTSAENESDTPDFILADYLMASLDAFDAATRCREKWYGREKKSVDDLPKVTETPAS